MSSSLQTVVALVIVAVAATWLIGRSLAKKKQTGCGSGECGAVSPEVKKLQARLKR